MSRRRARSSRISAALPLALALAFAAALAGCVSVPRELNVSPADDALARRVAAIAAKTPARLGIVFEHVESGRRLVLNEEGTFESASVVKVAILVEAMALSQEGAFDLTDRWKLSARAVAAGSGVLDEFEPGLSPTNRDLLRIMISLSDNTATNSFIDRFGAGAINARMAALGLPGIRLVGRIPDAKNEPERWSPLGSLTPRDTAAAFRRLWTSGLLDPASDFAMREFFRAQRTTSRIPRLLLAGKKNTWAGKTGSMHGVRNDAGVLTTPKGRFVLVVLADRIPDDDRDGPAVTRAMGELAKAAVDAWSETLPDLALPPDEKPPPRLLPAVPPLELTPRQVLDWPGAPGRDRVLREADVRFWELWQFVSLDHRAWHAGPSLLHGRTALNRTSIGIEITGDSRGTKSSSGPSSWPGG